MAKKKAPKKKSPFKKNPFTTAIEKGGIVFFRGRGWKAEIAIPAEEYNAVLRARKTCGSVAKVKKVLAAVEHFIRHEKRALAAYERHQDVMKLHLEIETLKKAIFEHGSRN
jgi:hypothetical protein